MKDRDGNEWRMVPVNATEEMIADMLASKDFDGIWPAAIAAAPQFVAGEVKDEACLLVYEHWLKVPPGRRSQIQSGRAMISAVRAELGPALGLVTREEMAAQVKDAYIEGQQDADDGMTHWREIAENDWLESNARKRLEAK